jgi:hypothetical protein
VAATPMIDDVELKAVQWARQETDQGFARRRVAGLDGTLHQKVGRRSHRVVLSGVLLPATAPDDLKKLQEKAAAGAEVSFTADIATALAVSKMVLESFAAEQRVGPAGQYAFTVVLAESPPLPPPAEVSPFGGLDGLGDLGFDAGALGDVLSDIQDQAGALTGALDAALDAVEQVTALAGLADLGSLANPVKPLADKAGELADVGTTLASITDALKALF